jgi:hypothetical protein
MFHHKQNCTLINKLKKMFTWAALYATMVFSAASFLSAPVLNSARYLIMTTESVKRKHNPKANGSLIGIHIIILPVVVTLHLEIEDLGLGSS